MEQEISGSLIECVFMTCFQIQEIPLKCEELMSFISKVTETLVKVKVKENPLGQTSGHDSTTDTSVSHTPYHPI